MDTSCQLPSLCGMQCRRSRIASQFAEAVLRRPALPRFVVCARWLCLPLRMSQRPVCVPACCIGKYLWLVVDAGVGKVLVDVKYVFLLAAWAMGPCCAPGACLSRA
jgi:hypothetical protein